MVLKECRIQISQWTKTKNKKQKHNKNSLSCEFFFFFFVNFSPPPASPGSGEAAAPASWKASLIGSSLFSFPMASVPGRDEACSRSPTAGQTDQGPHLHWEAVSRGRGYRQSFQTTPAGEGNTARLPRDYRERVERRELEETNPPPSTSQVGRMR